MHIKTTHVGSLPRPNAMNAKRQKNETVSSDELKVYVEDVLERQLSLGIDYVNNGELPRSDYINSTISRISGFFESGIAPIPADLEDLPEYSRKFGARNGLITLNPKAPVKLPACSEDLVYLGENTLRLELEMMISAFNQLKPQYPQSEAELFFTSPSPGTIALFLDNRFYDGYEAYVQQLGNILKQEYEIISNYGILLQVDCPDLAMGRHTRFKNLDDDQFLNIMDANLQVLNRALENVPEEKCRVHICWGNYAGTHHHDIALAKIYSQIMKAKAKYISIESSNHRHAHEWEIFKELEFPEGKVLMPGVIDTTSNNIEHPKLIAQRLTQFARLVGADRVIGSTDCGFASTASATSVSGEIAWLKLKSLVAGAQLASEMLQS